MSSLTMIEKRSLENLFGMLGGYVLDFSNYTFKDFFSDLGIEIESQKYSVNGTSKARRLRELWKQESDTIVGETLSALIEYSENNFYTGERSTPDSQALIEQGRKIAKRLNSVPLSNGFDPTAFKLEGNYINNQIKRMRASIQNDPSLAIGTAKEFIETCCKTILKERSVTFSSSDDMPKLIRSLLKSLNLLSDQVEGFSKGEDLIKRLLSNFASIGYILAELRGLYGTGHGKDANTFEIEEEHAGLAVGSAETFVNFVFKSHIKTKNNVKNNS